MRKNASHRFMLSAIVYWVILPFLLISLPLQAHASNVTNKTRQINIVYDDSGSMFGDTTWSECKYATQVFAGMMGENDTIRIFPMSSYNSPIELKGSGDAQSNIRVVQNLSGTSDTPFNAVRAAADDIEKSEADEKWLVVLTDGGFTDTDFDTWRSELLGYTEQNGVKVIYTTIGMENQLANEQKENFYPYEAHYNQGDSRSTILETMTRIATRVFNYKAIELSGIGTDTVSFEADIPLSKIIIFSQGGGSGVDNVLVNDMPLQDFTESSVIVKVDEHTGKTFADAEVAPDLNGEIYTATATDESKPFANGTYSFSCNTDNVQVFVEPGVIVDVFLVSPNGERIRLEDSDQSTITEGDWTVDVQMINPLTGEEVDPAQSDILSDASMDVVVKTDDGTVEEYSDGDTISVSGKEIEIYGRTRYKGVHDTIEKTGKIHRLKVQKSPLLFIFGSPGGYELDAVALRPDADIVFTVTVAGKQLTSDQLDKLKLDVKETQGIKWEIEAVDDKGSFRLIPHYAKRKGIDGVTSGIATLEVTGSAKIEGDKREGTGTAEINIITESKAGLLLDLDMPQEQAFDSENAQKYMFDARLRGLPGKGEDRPYILVTVQAVERSGQTRLLTDEEWEKGLAGFSYNASSINPSFLWKMIKVLTIGGQRLEFVPIKGPNPSTYYLYLDGLSELNVLPNTSELQIDMKITYDNGGYIWGSNTGTVTVMPLAWWQYLAYLIVLTSVLIVLIAILVRELTKPRIPGDFKPVITVTKTLAGTPQPPIQGEHYARIRRMHRWSLFKPEQCRVHFDSKDTNIDIPFTVTATQRGLFIIENVRGSFVRVRRTVMFNHSDYDKICQNPSTEFETGDTITYSRSTGETVYEVRLTF